MFYVFGLHGLNVGESRKQTCLPSKHSSYTFRIGAISMMDVTDVAQRLKLSFEIPPRGSVSDAIALISASVREFSVDSFQACPTWLAPLEAKLLDVYENSVPHNSVRQLEGFLSVLFTLKSLLPASSIISWFDHLRTALREPRLGMDARQGLREMLGSVLKDPAHSAESRSRDFRRRLLELYLFDASPGVKSAQEVIEDLNRKTEEHEAEKAWKENLECILASDVATSPNVGHHCMVTQLSSE